MRVESQRQVVSILNETKEGEVFFSKQSSNNKRDQKKFKNKSFCENYKRSGHLKDSCFKLIGYPDWYKEKMNKDSAQKVIANVTNKAELTSDTPLDAVSLDNQELGNLIATALLKMLKPNATSISFNITLNDFAGNPIVLKGARRKGSWSLRRKAHEVRLAFVKRGAHFRKKIQNLVKS